MKYYICSLLNELERLDALFTVNTDIMQNKAGHPLLPHRLVTARRVFTTEEWLSDGEKQKKKRTDIYDVLIICQPDRSRLVPEAWQQWSEMEALIPSPAACEVRSVIKLFNGQSIAPIEMHRQLCQVYGPNISLSLPLSLSLLSLPLFFFLAPQEIPVLRSFSSAQFSRFCSAFCTSSFTADPITMSFVYRIISAWHFVDDIRSQHWLPSTGPYQELVSIRDRKKKEKDLEFYTTSAMLDDSWTRECRSQRHVTTRLAVHGFHHKICVNNKFHEPTEDCKCVLCGQRCRKYHIVTCAKRVKPITDYGKD
ncbi:hypothetical protein ANN_02118 [Periplaneta americana]|uniref:Uncharacterized protein n=1 Tax=Periplaneta americana TaxID=6978 RepID=A0ABQ8TVH7_PERAM|nr:hypothetical protein ANN_02118 [Periplaneta americana]